MLGLSWGEIAVVLVVLTLIFGWSWVPRIGATIGSFASGVKKGLRQDDERIVVKSAPTDEPRKPTEGGP